VEGVTAILFGLVAFAEGATWLLPALLATTWAIVVATVIDLEHRIIPNRLTYPLPFVLLGLLLPPTFIGFGSTGDLVRGLISAIAVPGAFLLVAELYRWLRGVSGFGMGDIKLLVSLGLVCGYLGGFEVIVLLYGAMATAVLVAVVLLATGRAGLMSKIPFGPYLAAGTLLAILVGDQLRGPVLEWLGLA
jgi:leader peptidase (prepilin peptidase)/N-methyltransferase